MPVIRNFIENCTIQYNTIQYNTIQYNTIQYNTIQYNTIQYNTIQYNTIQYNTIQYNTIQYNTFSSDGGAEFTAGGAEGRGDPENSGEYRRTAVHFQRSRKLGCRPGDSSG